MSIIITPTPHKMLCNLFSQNRPATGSMASISENLASHRERYTKLSPAINEERATDAIGLFDAVELQKLTIHPLVRSI